jgi:hypothetical protein
MTRSLLTGMCLLALAGCASAPQKQAPTAQADAAPATCLSTGSRVPRERNECASIGRSYSAEELQQTGHIDTARALQALDPSITASGGGH